MFASLNSTKNDKEILGKIQKSLRSLKPGKLLGLGGYGSVYRVKYKDTEMAMKIVKKEDRWLPDNPMTDAEHEIQMMDNIGQHAHLIFLFESYPRDKVYPGCYTLMFMELATGGDLFKSIINRKTYSENMARDFIFQICKGVAFMHEKLICHRDLKLDNVLLNPNDQVKIADFGFAEQLSDKNQYMTDTCGTSQYMAPELIRNDIFQFQMNVDQWALGVIAFLLQYGQFPFSNQHDQRMGRHHLMGESNPKLKSSQGSQDFIKSLLTYKPEDRPSFDKILEHKWFDADEKPGARSSVSRAPFSVDHRKAFTQQQAKRNVRKMVNFSMTIIRFEDLLRFVETEEKTSKVNRFSKPKRKSMMGSIGRKTMGRFSRKSLR